MRRFPRLTEVMDMEEKKCTKCGVAKPLADFSKNRSRKDGLEVWCRLCKGEANAEYQKAHPEVNRAKVARYQKRHPERVRESGRLYRETHREARRVAYAKWVRDYPEVKKAAEVRWVKTHPEARKAINRARRARKAAVEESFSAEEEQFIRECWGNRCVVCGKTNEEEMAEIGRSLAVDHWLPLCKGYALTPSNAVLMCLSCNAKKGPKMPSEVYDAGFIGMVETKMERGF